jgi:hypothetical protein
MVGEKLTQEEMQRAEELRLVIYPDGGFSAGCCWHVVLDDGNYGDDMVTGTYPDPNHAACVEIKPLLTRMSKTQREKFAHGGYDRRKK